MHFEKQEDSFKKKDFSPFEFLNTYCKDLNLFQLNSLLADLNKTIHSSDIEQKDLVKKNFSKFLACKNTIDKIRKEDNLKKIDIKEFEKESKNIKKIFMQIIENAKINLEEESKQREREALMLKYAYIFKGPTELKILYESKDYEGFVLFYKKARKEYKKLKESKYIKSIWKKIKKLRNILCNELALKIESKESQDKILYYFSVYFKLKRKGNKNKIENTLLTNLKVFLKSSLEYLPIKDVEKLFSKVQKNLKAVNTFFMHNIMLNEFFNALNDLLKLYDSEELVVYHIFLSKLQEFYLTIKENFNNMVILNFLKRLEKLEVLTCKIYLKNSEILLKKDLKTNGNLFEKKIKKGFAVFEPKIIKEEVQHILIRSINYANIKKKQKNKKFIEKKTIEYLENINKLQFKINSISTVLNVFNENLDYSFLNNLQAKISKQEILAFSDLLIPEGRDEEILMLAVKLKNKIPLSFSKLLSVKEEIFFKNDLLKFFLQKYIKNYKPVNVNQTNEKFKKLYKSFGFLII